MTALINQVPYLRDVRDFPEEQDKLVQELSKAYIDTATAVNARTIGLFSTTKAAINGEKWYLSQNKAQQAIRRAYSFTSTASIDHGITLSDISSLVRIFGTYTDGTNWYGLITTSWTAIAGQIGIYVSPTQIVFTTGADAPKLTAGIVVLEWISFV